jgi:hypothetical protein
MGFNSAFKGLMEERTLYVQHDCNVVSVLMFAINSEFER